LYASYGDKWVILSYLKKFLELQQNARIIAAPEDRELIRIFVGLETLSRQFIFIDSHTIKKFSDEIGPLSASTAPLWVDYSSLDQTRAVLKLGFPAGGIRHLHIVKYPYFSDLILVHGVSYSTLIKTFLYLPSKVKPAKPIYYNDNDRRDANDIINNLINKSVKSVIFNTVNFSHEPFSIHQIDVIIREFESENIQVLVNVTQMLDPSSLDGVLSNSKMAKSFTIPGHLYDLIIGNPPYSDIEEFIFHSLNIVSNEGYVVFLMRLAMLESQKRGRGMWRQTPLKDVWISIRRISFTGDGHSDDTAYGTFVWKNDYTNIGEFTGRWMDWSYDVKDN
jgi:hypothetical protein